MTDEEQPLKKSERINLGLAILSALAEPHAQLSCEDIAAWCDCDPESVKNIEHKAIAAVRRAMVKAIRQEKIYDDDDEAGAVESARQAWQHLASRDSGAEYRAHGAPPSDD